jgi:hypothetical protein
VRQRRPILGVGWHHTEATKPRELLVRRLASSVHRSQIMSLCAACGMQLGGDATLCAHHAAGSLGWATENRIMCDLLHRGIVPPRLSAAERDELVIVAEAA